MADAHRKSSDQAGGESIPLHGSLSHSTKDFVTMRCTLCGTALVQRIDSTYHDCTVCHALVMDTAFVPGSEEELRHYHTHDNDVHDPRYRRFTSPITEHVLKHFTAQHSGLDYGCGPGPVISTVLHEHGYRIAQYDPFFYSDTQPLTDTYDYIVCCEVIEHFHCPAEEFARLRSMLRPGGHLVCMSSLYHADIDFANWRYRKDPTHVFILRAETVGYIAEHFGFGSAEVRDGRFIVWK